MNARPVASLSEPRHTRFAAPKDSRKPTRCLATAVVQHIPLRSPAVAEVEVGKLNISPRTADKLREKHDLDADEVRAAVEGVGGLPFRWDNHPERGLRAILVVAVRDQAVQVVLYPAVGEAADVWNLGSAYPV